VTRFFYLSVFTRELSGLVLKTSDGCVFLVDDSPLALHPILQEMLDSGRFINSKRGKYRFVNGFPALEVGSIFESFCELIYHQLEEQHLLGGESGAFLMIETLERQLAGHLYHTKSKNGERIEIYVPTGRLRKTLQQLQDRGFGLFWFNGNKIGLIKYSPDETGFVPKKAQDKKL
jgi:hypothetical protein